MKERSRTGGGGWTSASRAIIWPFIAAFLGALVTFAGTLLGAKDVETTDLSLWLWILSLVLLGLIVILLFVQYVQGVRTELSHERDALEADKRRLEDEELIAAAVPTFLRFSRWENTITIRPDGSALLRWVLTVNSPEEENVTGLYFPIFAEWRDHEEDAAGRKPSILSVQVEETDVTREADLISKEVRESQVRDTRTSYWLLYVPVGLETGRRDSRVEMEFEFAKLFEIEGGAEERYWVDVPYVTEELIVKIVAGEVDGRRALPRYPIDNPGASNVEATSLVMDTGDRNESDAQDKKYRQSPDGLEWIPDSVKLGYRYRLRFRCDIRDDATESPGAP